MTLPSRTWALVALLVFFIIYGSVLYIQQNLAGHGCCGATWPTPDPTQAERLIAKADPAARNAAMQRSAAVDVLTARPMDSNAWLRLAYADGLAHGRFTDEGLHAFEMSYLVAPYAGHDTPGRLVFALDNWTAVTPSVRRSVMAEIAIMDKDDAVRGAARVAGRKIQTPAGRMTAILLGLETNYN